MCKRRPGLTRRFLPSEDVNSHEVALGVAVLASLGGGHVNNLRAQHELLVVVVHSKILASLQAPTGAADPTQAKDRVSTRGAMI